MISIAGERELDDAVRLGRLFSGCSRSDDTDLLVFEAANKLTNNDPS